MIREDRELLAELARLNTDMISLCMRIIDGSASAAEQVFYACRLIARGNGWVGELMVREEQLLRGRLSLTDRFLLLDTRTITSEPGMV